MKTVTIRAAALTLVLGLSLVQIDGGWLWNLASADGSSLASQPGVHILDSDETGITLELYTPDFQVEQIATEEITCDRLSVTDYVTNDQAGWPALPMRGAMLGIPPDANVTLTVLSIDAKILSDHYNPCPVATPVMETELSGEIRFGGYQLVRDIQAYATDALWPTHPAELVETGFIRSQRVAQVRFHPFQYSPTSGEVRHLERIQVRLDFNRDFALDGAAFGAIDEGAFEETLSHTLLNYDTARRWRTRAEPVNYQGDVPDFVMYKISVDTDGIYKVTYTELLAAGANVDALDPQTFSLSSQGQGIAIYVEGETDGSFDPGDYILFYGQKMNTKYTDVNVYWLTWGYTAGKRMQEIDGSPGEPGSLTPLDFQTTQRVEKNLSYRPYYPNGPDNDRWFWHTIVATAPTQRSYPTTLQNIATTPFSATVRGYFHGYYGDHHTQVYINGHLIDDSTWSTEDEYMFEVSIPHSYLIEGSNNIVVQIPFDQGGLFEVLFINLFEIVYQKTFTAETDELFFSGEISETLEYHVSNFYTDTIEAFDITTPTNPSRILSTTLESAAGVYTLTFAHTITDEHRYISLATTQRLTPLTITAYYPSNIRTSTSGADYVIITHADFYTEVLTLASYRASQGLRVEVIDVADIYDEFSYGIFDPEAIREFMTYVYASWPSPAPTYVLLVGDGNYDFKNYEGTGEINYIPPFLADVDPEMGETVADNRYVCVSGSDALPDMHLGRLPVKTSAEVTAIISKIIAYEQSPPEGDWNKRVLFVADDADGAGDFAALSDDVIATSLPEPYMPDKVYLGVTHPWEFPAVTAHHAVTTTINGGLLLVNYIGHGDTQVWAGERLFTYSDIDKLTNGDRLPLMVPMTCKEGYFIIPSSPGQDRSAISEGLLRAPNKGGIASWAPTGLGAAAGHDYLNKGLFEALFSDYIIRLGPATTQGKLYLYSHTGGYRDLLDTYILLGDPALSLNVIQYKWYFPIVVNNYPSLSW